MMALDVSPQALSVLVGLLYVLVALTVWALLYRRHPPLPLAMWSLGSSAAGLSMVLLGARQYLPAVVVQMGSFGLAIASFVLRILALRADLGRPPAALVGLACWLLPVACFQVVALLVPAEWRSQIARATLMTGTALLAWQAHRAGRSARSRNGMVLAWVEGALAAVLALRLAGIAMGRMQPWPEQLSWDVALLMSVTLVSALYGNLGYLGMVLDRLRRAEYQARRAQMAEAARREAAEQAASELRALLAQRDHLTAERDQLMQVLAHEIRQPLHNASGALQAAAMLVQSPQPADAGQVSARLMRAQGVLGDVRSVLDNTLAAALTLTRREPLVVQDVDLHLLVSLVLGDLPESQRARTRVEWCTPLRSAEIEPGMVRLALRNLMRNAFEHGGPDVQVVLRIEEQDEPAAMVLVVADDGQGRLAALLEAGSPPHSAPPLPGQRALPRRGLGLYIVRRVMAMHHGRLVLSANPPRGLQARLVFPDPTEAAR
jgi:signal transduction histidine kinase